MRIFSSLSQEHYNEKPLAIALGYFDGLHLGHRAVIQKVLDLKKDGFVPAVFTFSIDNNQKVKENGFLYPFEQRLLMLEELGVEVLLCPQFSEFSNFEPTKFVELLATNFNVQFISCGEDFSFGKNKKGNIQTLENLSGKFDFTLKTTPSLKLKGKRVSTSQIKQYLAQGLVQEANEMLGSPYFVKQTVVKGKQLGRTIERPTINQHFHQGQFVPKFGAYSSIAKTEEGTYFCSSNIGMRPTVGGEFPICETYLMDFAGDLYGQTIGVYFFEFIREEKKFNNLEEIKDNVLEIAKHSQAKNYSI